MINILPLEDKKEIKKDYFKRLIIVVLVFFSLIMVMAIVMLLPTIFFLNEHENISRQELEYINKKIDDTGASQIKPLVDDLNKKVQTLNKVSGFRRYSDTVSEVIEIGGSGVKVSALSMKISGKKESIFISGVSATRKDLLSFVENLKKCKAGIKTQCTPFDKIELPVSNLLTEKDIVFSINSEVVSTIK